MLSEDERLAECERIAENMYLSGMGWNYDAIEKLTRPEMPAFAALRALEQVGQVVEIEKPNRHQRRARKHVQSQD